MGWTEKTRAQRRTPEGKRKEATQSAAQRERRKIEDPHYERRVHLRKRYGISLDDLRAMFDYQHGLCAVCDEPLPPIDQKIGTTGTNIDHCHVTGRIRGLLHARCNSMLGHAKDRPEVLEKAARYLRRAASGT